MGRARERRDAARVVRDLFLVEDRRETRGDLRLRQGFQIELQAARQDRDRNLLRIGGRQHELDVFRRFLQRLQHRVEGRFRQHVTSSIR